MKANELRLGNLIYDIPERGGKIISVNKVWIDDDGESLYFDLCNPIPLTEEWLIKFGFVKTDEGYITRTWKENDLNVILTSKHAVVSSAGNFGLVYFKPIKCVHQLQNLYFTLTGQELEINEKV
jgi:hypothetical protein